MKTIKSNTAPKRKPRTVAQAKRKASALEEKVKVAEADMIERAESLAGDQEYLQEYLYMYKSLKRLTRQAKRAAIESGSGRTYYAYCTLLSQQREVIADIRTLTDLSGQVDLLLNDVLQPFSQSVGQSILNSFYQLRKLAKETTVPKETQFVLKTIETIVKDMTRVLQHSYEIAASNTHRILVGEVK